MTPQTRAQDPNVRLPAAVLANARRAEELMQAQNQPPAETPPVETPAETPPELKMDATPPAPAPEPAPVTEPVTPPPPAGEADWERRYKAMKGRYDSEIGPLRDEVRRLNNLVTEYSAEIQTLQAQKPAKETTFDGLITDEERRDYGEDFLNVVAKRAKEVVGGELAAAQEKITKLEKMLGPVAAKTQQSDRQQMFAHLDEQVSNWREINTDANFLQWLDLPDAYTGRIRKDLLTIAYNENSGSKVAAFFKGFLREAALVAPPSQTHSDPSPKVPLESLAAPGRAKTAAPGRPADKPIFKRADITRFYSERAAGKWRGREKEAAALELQIHEAVNEGRVQ